MCWQERKREETVKDDAVLSAFRKEEEMSEIYNEIKQGFEQALAHAQNPERSEAEETVLVRDPTGAILSPGKPEICQGNGENPHFEICCDNCNYFLKCFPEYKDELDEALELLRDRAAYDRALAEYKRNPVTYTHNDIKKLFDSGEVSADSNAKEMD